MTIETYTGFGRTITIDNSRDKKLTRFAKETLKDRYLWTGETYQGMFARVSAVNSDDDAHAQRLYDAMSQLWFMPATPLLSNSGSKKNLTISCFLNEVDDSLEGIFGTQMESKWLSSRGGGIGTNYSPVRSIGEAVGEKDETGKVGETSGIIPFVVVDGYDTLAVSQGNLRRGSRAFYLRIDHPEIEEFIEIRNPHKGAPERKALHAHHAVIIPDAFMNAVKAGDQWDLIDPKSKAVKKTVNARKLWQQIIERRLTTGEPYLWFVDNANRQRPKVYVRSHLFNSTSNLCSEITLTTQIDYNNRRRTAVCCLSSLNLETYFQWQGNEQLIEDVLRFLDNNLEHFIQNTNGVPGFERANYAARMERSVGLGVMGFHSFLQQNMIPFEGVMAKVWNNRIFKWIKEQGDKVNIKLADERGACLDGQRVACNVRFAHMFAIAPTASISIICGEASPGVEPEVGNVRKQKTLSGNFIVRNKWLDYKLQCKYVELHDSVVFDEEYDKAQRAWVDSQWLIIMDNEHGKGSVQGLPYLTQLEKDVFKTAFEIDQAWIIDHAADRQQYICQGQSINLFFLATEEKSVINKLTFRAWQKGLKGLYYNRSRATAVATNVAGEMPTALPKENVELKVTEPTPEPQVVFDEPEECLACQ
jgi:ribonucleoside-diphosphate reductase alpha chain